MKVENKFKKDLEWIAIHPRSQTVRTVFDKWVEHIKRGDY